MSLLFALLLVCSTAMSQSFTEGVIDDKFVEEAEMKNDLLQMLADFSQYMANDWYTCQAPNSINEDCGFFKGENSGGSDERGVRPNADMSMVCAFLVKYGKPAGVTLPQGVTWEKIEEMARKSLVFAYSTHKANKLKICSNNRYWGSTGKDDAVWESSLWAMSVAYSAFFQWEKLSEKQKGYIYNFLKAECNYELERTIPTGYKGDTKAEENGWEADVLAATLGLFPDDKLAPQWFERLREFAVNSYSHPRDAHNMSIIDPWYPSTDSGQGKTIADLYRGQNLYDDYSLQNHDLFHTSYQNVVMQELGEAALALKMFQLGTKGTERWKTNALMHNNQEVQDSILNWLALPDGELAMPNGNDWSLFLYDQITSYSTLACFLSDPNALMLENMAYKYIKARQKTTNDGAWLLRADVGARRMGVQAHRVMMTYLMHEALSTSQLKPTLWQDFNDSHQDAKMLPCQNIIRAATDWRFTCFSWSKGLKSYTGYFAANCPDKNKIVVPYRANNTGNILGWYEVKDKKTNAVPVLDGRYMLDGNAYVMNGEINTNDGALNRRFAIYSTPQNAILYTDYVKANTSCTITGEKNGLLAISTDEFTNTRRTIYYDSMKCISNMVCDGTKTDIINSPWTNIDNQLGIISIGNDKPFAFADRSQNNSIFTSKLYSLYSDKERDVNAGNIVDAQNVCYYSKITAPETRAMSAAAISLQHLLPQGWNGMIVPDHDCAYLLASHFDGKEDRATIKNLEYLKGWAPVFKEETTINNSKATVTFSAKENTSVAQPIKVLIHGSNVTACLSPTEATITITARKNTKVSLAFIHNGQAVPSPKPIKLKAGETITYPL